MVTCCWYVGEPENQSIQVFTLPDGLGTGRGHHATTHTRQLLGLSPLLLVSTWSEGYRPHDTPLNRLVEEASHESVVQSSCAVTLFIIMV